MTNRAGHRLMRHPAPDIEAGLCYGRLDVPLLAGWEKQLADYPDQLRGTATIVSSPSRRCLNPAAWLAARLSAALVVESRLMELDFGEWEGQYWSAFDGEPARAWAEDPIRRAPPGGESMQAMASRVVEAFQDWTAAGGTEGTGGTGMLFVTHGGPIRVLLCHQRGLPLAQAFQLEVAYARLYALDDKHDGEQAVE